MPYKNPTDKRMADHRYRMAHLDSERERKKRWRRENIEEFRAYNRKHAQEWKKTHREKANEWGRRLYKKNPEKILFKNREWRKANKEKAIMRCLVGKMFRNLKGTKESQSYRYVGCTPGFLRNHIESQFKPGMNWSNYGEWHVDHIVPLSWFPFDRDPSLLFVASHWSNLQPMWGSENMSKCNRFAA